MALKAGLRIRNDFGTVQIDDNWISLAMSAKGTFQMTRDPSNRPQPMSVGSVTVSGVWPLIAFNGGGYAVSQHSAINNGNGTWTFHFRCQSGNVFPVSYWVFDQMDRGIGYGTTNWGLRVRRPSDGKIVFDAACKPLRIASILSQTMPVEAIPPTGGPQSGFAGTQLFTGATDRSYAAIQGAFGYVSAMWDSGAYSSDSQPPAAMRDADGMLEPGTRWRYMYLEGVNSTVAFPTANTARAGITSFERWQGWYPVGQQPSCEVHGSSVHWIIDVTDY